MNRVNFVASCFLPGGVLSKAKVCLQWRAWWVGSASVRKWGLLWSHEGLLGNPLGPTQVSSGCVVHSLALE